MQFKSTLILSAILIISSITATQYEDKGISDIDSTSTAKAAPTPTVTKKSKSEPTGIIYCDEVYSQHQMHSEKSATPEVSDTTAAVSASSTAAPSATPTASEEPKKDANYENLSAGSSLFVSTGVKAMAVVAALGLLI